MSVTDVTDRVTGPEIVLTIGIMASVGRDEVAVVEVEDTGLPHLEEGGGLAQGHVTEEGELAADPVVVMTGDDPDPGAETIRGEVLKRVNLAANLGQRADLNLAAGVGVLTKM